MKISTVLDYSILYQFDFNIRKNLELENDDELENENFDIELKSHDKNLIIQIPIIMENSIESEIIDSCGYTLILNKEKRSLDYIFSNINYLRMILILDHFSFCTESYIDSENDYFSLW